MKSLIFLFFFIPCVAMDSSLGSIQLQRPVMIHSTLPKLIEQCHLSSELVKKREKLFLRVKLYYRNLKVMQSEYELDLEKLSKL